VSRTLKVTVEAESGSIDRFYVFVDGRKRIAQSGERARSWEGSVGEEPARIRLRVTGRGAARYSLTLQATGAETLRRIYTLEEGYHEAELAF
jgi:hypothetical protein